MNETSKWCRDLWVCETYSVTKTRFSNAFTRLLVEWHSNICSENRRISNSLRQCLVLKLWNCNCIHYVVEYYKVLEIDKTMIPGTPKNSRSRDWLNMHGGSNSRLIEDALRWALSIDKWLSTIDLLLVLLHEVSDSWYKYGTSLQ